MGPSEAEIAERLADLRRRRDRIDREIADLLLYLELGRRLGGAEPGPAALPDPDPRPDPVPHPGPHPRQPAGPAPSRPAPAVPPSPASPPSPPSPPRPARPPGPVPAPDAPPAVAFADDPAGARRYGRALVAAACAALAEARRPLHASELLEGLLARGFTLPGRDPVAALNTRLWKRAGADGPLRRVGEATYALAEAGSSEVGSPEGRASDDRASGDRREPS